MAEKENLNQAPPAGSMEEEERRHSWKGHLLRGGLLSFVLLPVIIPPVVWMIGRWLGPVSCYSHGFLVPPIAGYLLWRKRRLLLRGKPSYWGLVILIPALLLESFAILVQFHFLTAFSLIFILLGFFIYFWGKRGFQACLFPILFLFFMVPLPLVIMADLTLRMKLFAIDGAVWIVRACQVEPVVEGNAILFSKGTLFVGEACSGLRSLIALLAMGYLLCCLSQIRSLYKGILFLSAVPAALLSNMIRIAFLSLIVYWKGKGAAGGWVHDLSGFAVYIMALFMLVGVEKLLSKMRGEAVRVSP